MFANRYNLKSPGVKRLMREAIELAEPTHEYHAYPMEDNLFEWHFTIKGPENTEFDGGYYHGRILLPSQYPLQPPNIILLTPNGRFEINKKICLSISGHHPESWQPSWSIRTALLALIAFMPTPAVGTIGSLSYTPQERQLLAKKSRTWECSICGKVAEKLISEAKTGPQITSQESSFLNEIAFKSEEESKQYDLSNKMDRDNSCDEVQTLNGIPPNTTNMVNQPGTEHVSQHSISWMQLETFWSAIIWTLVTLIGLLIFRRLFLL